MKISIYVTVVDGQWTARAYDDQTEQHIWSSEDASSVSQALSEVAAEIGKYERELEEIARLPIRDSRLPKEGNDA